MFNTALIQCPINTPWFPDSFIIEKKTSCCQNARQIIFLKNVLTTHLISENAYNPSPNILIEVFATWSWKRDKQNIKPEKVGCDTPLFVLSETDSADSAVKRTHGVFSRHLREWPPWSVDWASSCTAKTPFSYTLCVREGPML